MNTEDGAKLYDVCPHVSDSVRWLHPRSLGVGGDTSPVPQPWALQEGGSGASRQRAGGWPQTDCRVSASAFLEGVVVYQKV